MIIKNDVMKLDLDYLDWHRLSGRNAISWEEKFNIDVEYVDNVSFIGDWKIIFLTLKKVFVREGINSETAATMEPFKGTKKESVEI